MDFIPFYSVVEDEITGFKGAVTCCAKYLNGCVRYEVRPMVDKEGHLPEPRFIDGTSIKVITPGSLMVNTSSAFELGVKLRDKISKFMGKAVVLLICPHSGFRYGLQPRVTKKGEIPEAISFDEEDLEQVDPPPPPKKKGKEKKSDKPNGPHDPYNALAR